MKKSYLFLFIIFAFLTTSLHFGCNKRTSYISDRGMVWNTMFNITYEGSASLGDSIRKVLDETGSSLSVFDPASLVSKVNGNDTTQVNEDFIRVYEMSKKINSLSEGMFDPTLSPLITAWGFGPGHKASGDTIRLDSLLALTGIRKTRIEGTKLIKDNKGIQFNFSAIAKGYGCDRVAEMLKKNGVKNYLVEIGGEIVAAGKNPRGSEWTISVDRPIFNDSAIIHESQVIVAFSNKGMATSGNYRNYHGKGEKRYGHTISPLTGRPVATDILSATVIANSCMEADGLATAFMAMGRKKTEELNKSLKLPVLLICADTVWYSPEFKKLIINQ